MLCSLPKRNTSINEAPILNQKYSKIYGTVYSFTLLYFMRFSIPKFLWRRKILVNIKLEYI